MRRASRSSGPSSSLVASNETAPRRPLRKPRAARAGRSRFWQSSLGRGAELRGDRRRAGAPHRSGSPARPAQRWLCSRRLDRATPATRGLVCPIARRDSRPPPKTNAKVSCRSPSGPVVHRHHWSRRPLRAPSTSVSRSPIQACAAWGRHHCFGSPACSGGAFAMPRTQLSGRAWADYCIARMMRKANRARLTSDAALLLFCKASDCWFATPAPVAAGCCLRAERSP
jgi:hypothetical protein